MPPAILMVNFELSDEQLMLQELARDFANETENQEFLNFINSEVDGYKDDIPSYRIISGRIKAEFTDQMGRKIIQYLDLSGLNEQVNQVDNTNNIMNASNLNTDGGPHRWLITVASCV